MIKTENPRLIGLVTAISLVMANMIGTGVFTSLGYQAIAIQSSFVLLFLWFVGGIYALCGALSYGELAAAMPRSGGEYHYLSRIYHPAVGFLSGWVSVTVGFAAPIALAAIAFSQYVNAVFTAIPAQPLALIAVVVISLIHTRNLKVGSQFQDSFTLLKIILIVIFIICGLLLAKPQPLDLIPNTDSVNQIFSSSFAISLAYVTYSYSGWNAAIYPAGEVKNPEKNLPRSLLMGTAIVMLLYLLLNFVFLYATPFDSIQALEEKEKIAALAAQYIFGPVGGKIISLLIAFGLISTISAMVWAGPRVTQVIGEDIPFFQLLARKNSRGIPDYAILLQLIIVLVLLITSSFDDVVTYLEFTLILSSFFTVLGVFIHRWRYPNIALPYRTWGYPFTPIVFLGISLWVLVFIFTGRPYQSLAGLFTIFLGLPVYFLASRNKLA
ncbi:APC family permease [Gloeocapsa sp. PCC 73106]|uniref:APC family permease n=1 Tax=Gloeocapsa sp. PCC 73106 TaxID=102232 RepID=UPI0002ACD09F|nr:amino acid permease [Gloeocapsa sp. PCC 73106]ELR97156.1 amino acid transporter [Gloeocapsa sp. PCC 73106]